MESPSSAVPPLSWGDVAVIRDCSSAEPMKFVTMMGDDGFPPPAMMDCTSDDCSSDESSLEDESMAPPLHEEADVCACQTLAKDAKATKSGRSVSFGTLQIREYSLTIGSTVCTMMYPLSLDWEFAENPAQPLDEFESIRKRQRRGGGSTRTTRNLRAPRLSVTDRMRRLAAVTGRTSRALYTEERKRQLRLMEENRRAAVGLGPALQYC